jgi:hypothetical protein
MNAGIAAWGTGAKVVAIEYQDNLVALAKACLTELGLDDRVEVVCADVLDVDLSRGTAFYVYLSFTDEMADAVLAQIATVAKVHPVQILQNGRLWGPQPFVPEEVKVKTGGYLLRPGSRRSRRRTAIRDYFG